MREWERRAKDNIHKSRQVSLFSTVSLRSEKGKNCPAIGSKAQRRTRKPLLCLSTVATEPCYIAMAFSPGTETCIYSAFSCKGWGSPTKRATPFCSPHSISPLKE